MLGGGCFGGRGMSSLAGKFAREVKRNQFEDEKVAEVDEKNAEIVCDEVNVIKMNDNKDLVQ